MTTIAATKSQIACDVQATHPSGMKFKIKTKVHEFYQPLIYPTKFYMGFCGSLDSVVPAIDFFTDPTQYKKPPKISNAEFMVLTEDKKLFMFYNPAQWIAIDQPYYAIGSGMCYAMGAMAAGKTPLEAVKLAAKYDAGTGLGYKSFNVGK